MICETVKPIYLIEQEILQTLTSRSEKLPDYNLGQHRHHIEAHKKWIK